MPITEHEDRILQRIRAEYHEMPGLRLTREQAQRLFGLPEPTCTRLLDTLVADEQLTCRPDGTYVRRLEGLRVARATLRDTRLAGAFSRTA
jgi:DNA-binding IclR family transcriptional regulator